jgi:ATP-dependent RNA helicase DeaD
MGLSERVLAAINDMGYTEPTPIQSKAIIVALGGKDIIGQAQTGTGKTAAYGIPMVEKCDPSSEAIQGLVICPTRELASQVAEELGKIGIKKGVRTIAVYGGEDVHRQIHELKSGPQIVVGTPGRLIDHVMRLKTIVLDSVRVAVVDEADQMLDMGFATDIETLLKKSQRERQTLLFSATMPEPVQKLARRYLKNAAMIGVQTENVGAPAISQKYVEVQEGQKFETLCKLLIVDRPGLAIVFGRTRVRVEELYEALSRKGYSVRGLHGELEQSERDSVMRQFKEGCIQVLVATDVASRGLDFSGVTHVYNFDVPQDPEGYVHRIGRTGRMGKEGIATTFVVQGEEKLLKVLEQVAGQRIIRVNVPAVDDVKRAQKKAAIESILQEIKSGKSIKYRKDAESLLVDRDPADVLAAAMGAMIKDPYLKAAKITDIAPARMKEVKHPKETEDISESERRRKYSR